MGAAASATIMMSLADAHAQSVRGAATGASRMALPRDGK
jgi:hypothetical protein